MKISRIEIQIENNWRYGLVAFLVDREDFIKDVEQSRQELKISKLLDRSKIEKEQALRNEKATIKKYGRSPINGIILYISTKYDDIALKLQSKYRKSDNFRSVIKFAVISGMVLDKDYGNEEPLIFVPNKDEGRSEIPVHYPNIAILINPETHPDKLKRKFIDFLKRNKFDSNLMIADWILPDTVSNIKRDREWYWQKRTMSWEQLYKSVQHGQNPKIPNQTIRTAVRDYKKMLAQAFIPLVS